MALRCTPPRLVLRMISIQKGLDVPISGKPEPQICDAPGCSTVALVGSDYVGLKLVLRVREGEQVELGQPLFDDKQKPGVTFTSPAGGTVEAIHRGAKRRFLSLVIRVAEQESQREFDLRSREALTPEGVREDLLVSGLWTVLRTRPFSKVPAADAEPRAIFVTAMDTEPLAADPALILAEAPEEFAFGLRALTCLTSGPVFVCHRAGSSVPGEGVEGVRFEQFAGPHPAGLVGTHIHFLAPVDAERVVWHLDSQDVLAMGRFLRSGRLDVGRVIGLGGPSVTHPRLMRTRIGADLSELVADELQPGAQRVISGSVLSGRIAEPPVPYLGRFHRQIAVLPEAAPREFLGWLVPGLDRFSATRTFARAWWPTRRPPRFTTSLGGSRRAMVPMGIYERVVPLDLLPTQLLRALIVGDTDQAQDLGCLELDEEDLALCTFVCPSKYEYGRFLRENLTKLEIEG